jgi:hypothetical protein
LPTVKIYLPKTADNYEGALGHVQTEMCDVGGGLTSWDAQGRWEDGGEIVTEPVTVLETAVPYVWDDARTFEEDLCRDVIELTDETEVVATVGGEKIVAKPSA